MNPGLMGIAQERDFYRFQVLTENDIEFVRKVIGLAIPDLQAIHNDTLTFYLQAQHALALAAESKGEFEKLDQAARVLECNFLEDWHTATESSAYPHLRSLIAGDATFYQSRTACIDFATYLAAQHLRTQKHRDISANRHSPIDIGTLQRTWPLMVLILATNMAWHLFVSRKQTPIRIIHNETNEKFLTADQPVLNTLADAVPEGQPPPDSALYYPVSPTVAILIGADARIGERDQIYATPAQVSWLNSRMVAGSHRHVFACTEIELKLRGAASGA